MKHQQVSVDYWTMGKSMLTYGALTALVWIMLRLFSAAFALPGRLRAQQQSMENTLRELQTRYPELNITEEDLKNADKELDEFLKENEDEIEPKPSTSKELEQKVESSENDKESKKSI